MYVHLLVCYLNYKMHGASIKIKICDFSGEAFKGFEVL